MLERKSVAFLGPEASYTHQAALATFPPSTHNLIPYTTIPAVFAAVQTRDTSYGVVPFYNTTYGAVIATLDSLATTLPGTPLPPAPPPSSAPPPADTVAAAAIPPPSTTTDQTARYADICVHGDVTLPIRHCLLGYAESDAGEGNGGADNRTPHWPHISYVYSHEQALGQCERFLSTHLPQAERVSDTSTSRAAERIATTRAQGAADDGAVAAISSEMAAGLYGVPVLARDIQDADDNTTRFLVLENGVAEGEQTSNKAEEQMLTGKVEGTQTSLLVFAVPHTAPGALARCLALLERQGLNAVGIQQRPPNKLRSEDAIFVEVQGPAVGVGNAVEELAGLTAGCRLLGSWESKS